MPPQPVLELGYAPVGHRDRAWCLAWHDPALAQELDELARPLHIRGGNVLLVSPTRASASVSRKAADDGLVDVGDRDPGMHQPVRQVARCISVATDRQVRIPDF